MEPFFYLPAEFTNDQIETLKNDKNFPINCQFYPLIVIIPIRNGILVMFFL